MNLDQILSHIRDNYADEDIRHLVEDMASGSYQVRKQLADMIAVQPAKMPPLIILEVSRWGVNDDLSDCAEIRRLAK